jgi:hypothetical protein
VLHVFLLSKKIIPAHLHHSAHRHHCCEAAQLDIMQTAVRAQVTVAQAQQAKPQPKVVAAMPRVAKALGAGVASLALALSANAATVKLGE